MRSKLTLDKTLASLVAAVALLASGVSHAHSGPLNGASLEACKAKVKSQLCQYDGAHNDLYIGTCQYMSATLMCVRNQPIQKKPGFEHTDAEEHTNETHEK